MIERSAAPGGVWGWLLVGLWLALAPWVGATAQESPSRQAILDVFCQGNTEQRLGAIADLEALFLTGGASRAWAQETVSFLLARGLRCGDGVILFRNRQRDHFDALSLEPVAPPEERTKSPIVNLRLRGRLEVADGAMALLTTVDAAQQLEAMALLQRRYQDLNPRFIAEAQRVVQDEGVAAGLRDIQSLLALSAPDKATRLGAIARTAQQPSQRNLTLLTGRLADPDYSADDDIRQALEAAIAEIEYQQTLAESLAVAYSGLSYASVLFMAALGLAIIFGLMGVINLAQGEFIMLGAYVTFMVQQAFALWAPGLLDWYLLAAIPFAFGVTGLIGVAVEGSVIRHLYGRPLMTLLATWAVSLLLINGVRVTFGTQNLEFFTPFYASGGVTVLGDFIVTYNRLFAIIFAVATLALTFLLLRYTSLGLFIRAVSQNRTMAGCTGVSTRRVDALAFGFGSGLAGLGGLALSQIYNVNPTMGTHFIVDAFMVVVMGGVGSLAGTALAALGIGQINVFIEPLYGAVAAKVIVLLMIIGFIQVRPEGLFAPRGRR